MSDNLIGTYDIFADRRQFTLVSLSVLHGWLTKAAVHEIIS